MTIENMKFSPDSLRISLGDRVVFKNNDLVTHTATAKNGIGVSEPFDSGPLTAGIEWGFTPNRAGLTTYACTFHPVMVGRIEVIAP